MEITLPCDITPRRPYFRILEAYKQYACKIIYLSSEIKEDGSGESRDKKWKEKKLYSFGWDTGGKGTQVLGLTEKTALKCFLKNRMWECGPA
jgi:hypothetical protein